MSENFDERIKAGLPVIANCVLGLGIMIDVDATGERVLIHVAEEPMPEGADPASLPALRDHMEEIAVRWLKRVAPHRLNNHSSEY